MKLPLSTLLAAQLLLPISQAQEPAFAPVAVPVAEGITAIGDVHGDFATFQKLLRKIGLIDEADRWCGGRRKLVQTGDLIHRGTESRKVLDLVMRLEEEARAAGGELVVLIGNHEAMDLYSDLRYNTPEEYAEFAADEEPELRERRRAEILGRIRQGSPHLRSDYYRQLGRFLNERTFARHFPRGFFAHRRAFSREGRYGKWILGKSVIHRDGGTIFLHAGLSPRLGKVPLEALDRKVKGDLERLLALMENLEKRGVFDSALGHGDLQYLVEAERREGGPAPELADTFQALREVMGGILIDEEGPFWYRGLAQDDEALLAPSLEEILRFHGAERIVIGHTQPRGLAIEARFGGKVYLIDSGMNQKVYRGRPGAIVIGPDGKVEVKE